MLYILNETLFFSLFTFIYGVSERNLHDGVPFNAKRSNWDGEYLGVEDLFRFRLPLGYYFSENLLSAYLGIGMSRSLNLMAFGALFSLKCGPMLIMWIWING